MKTLNYCLECRRVFESNERCEFCSSDKIKPKLICDLIINIILCGGE